MSINRNTEMGVISHAGNAGISSRFSDRFR